MTKLGWNAAFLIASIVAFACAAGLPSPNAAAGPIEDLSPGYWYEVPNSHLRQVLPSPVPPGNPVNIMRAWSGAAYDSKRDRLVVWGGGHGDYGGNELYTFDLSRLSWSRVWGPSPDIPPIGQPCKEALSDNNPAARHTYGGLQYLPNVDRFWSAGGSLWCGSGAASRSIWTFDFAGLHWEWKGSFPGLAELEQASAFDPVTGHVFFANVAAPFFEYDPVKNAWQRRGEQGIGHDKSAVIDPKRRKLVVVGGREMFVFDLRTFSRKSGATGDTAILNARYPGLVYDAVSDRIIAWNGGADVYALDVDTMAWARRRPSGSVVPTAATPTGTFGRWQYIPSKNVFIGVNGIDENVYIYRLAPDAGTQAQPVPAVSAVDGAEARPASRTQTDVSSTTRVSPQLKPDVSSSPQASQSPNPDVSSTPQVSPQPKQDVSPTARVSLPLKQWVALPAPAPHSGKGIPSANKHVSAAYHPPSGRIYFTGGDYAGGGGMVTQSYRQETWSLSIAERLAAPSDSGAGWRLEYPYCGPAGQMQPKHPDYMGWVWDARRGLFHLIPGVMDSTADSNCPGETPDKQTNPGFVSGRMMSFDPATRRWAMLGSGDPGPDAADTWQSVLDPATDTLIRFGPTMKVNRYSLAGNRWAVSAMPRINAWKEYLAADFEKRAIYVIDGLSGHLHRYDMDSGSFVDLGATPEGPIGYTNLTYVAWDSVNKTLFWHKEGGAFFAYHPERREWEKLSIESNVPGVRARGRLLVYDPGQNVLLLYGGSDAGTPYLFLYRYGSGPAATPQSRTP